MAEANRSRDRLPALWLLWFAILAAPSAWSAHLSVEYFLVTLSCQLNAGALQPWMYAAAAALVTLCVAGLVAAMAALRQLRRAPGESIAWKRSQFMAVAGLILSGFFLVLTVAGTIPIIFLEPCNATH